MHAIQKKMVQLFDKRENIKQMSLIIPEDLHIPLNISATFLLYQF